MSAVDDLREAAQLLRERATGLPDAFPKGQPWRVVITDSESPDGVAACGDPVWQHDEHEVCPACWCIDTHSESLATYIASMHPLVALALAELFEQYAERAAAIESLSLPALAPYGLRAVAAIALAYLGRSG